MNRSRGRIHPIPHPWNAALMASLFPGFTYTYNRGGEAATWRGTLQPREYGPQYDVRVTYRIGERPRVKVLSPEIHPDAPHRYPKDYLCLYYPKDRSWHSGLYIARTIVPWTAEWLFFYELWVESGTWWGPEAPHAPNTPKQPE